MLDIKNRETLEIYVLGDDFKFYQNLKYLPLTSYPSNNQSALIIYCLGGKAKITVHEDVHWIQPEELIIQSPNQKIPDRKTKCVIKTHINIKQNVIFGAKLKPV